MEDKKEIIEQRIQKEQETGQKILGSFLMAAGIINVLEAVVKVILRLIYGSESSISEGAEAYLAIIKLIAMTLEFIYSIRKMKKLHYHSPMVRKITDIWGIILIPVQLIYEVCVVLYNNMLDVVLYVLEDTQKEAGDLIYAMFYNSTHGFKYIGMFIALLLGIVMTALILEKNKLFWVCGGFALLYMVAFAIPGMTTLSSLSTPSGTVGVNGTSLVYNLLSTVVLFGLGFYIAKVYKKEIVL